MSDWSSDVCSSDLAGPRRIPVVEQHPGARPPARTVEEIRKQVEDELVGGQTARARGLVGQDQIWFEFAILEMYGR